MSGSSLMKLDELSTISSGVILLTGMTLLASAIFGVLRLATFSFHFFHTCAREYKVFLVLTGRFEFS